MKIESNNMSQLMKRLFYFHPLLFSFCLPFGTLFLSQIIFGAFFQFHYICDRWDRTAMLKKNKWKLKSFILYSSIVYVR